ncbi:MAG: hypothetical protein J6W13_11250 [Salinivirgaceae bacterium]|nr:hypothetical protein [Salinivirgaceae bacterium]
MKTWAFILIALVSLCSCKRGYAASWFRLLRPASKVITIVKEDKQTASCTIDLTPKVLSKEELADSAEFKCYHVKLQLPQDTMAYLALGRIGLPGVIGIEEIPYAKVEVDFFLHNDTVNRYDSAVWVYKNDPPEEIRSTLIINYLRFGIFLLLPFLCCIILITKSFRTNK